MFAFVRQCSEDFAVPRWIVALSATVFFALASPLACWAQATEVGGIKFEPTQQVANTRLSLNGAGIRYKTVFKVYAAGLYLGSKAETAEQVLSSPGPKRIQIVMFRDIEGSELGKLMTRGMEDNAPREEFMKVIPGTLRMGDLFARQKRLLAGDTFTMDWIPGSGTLFTINGKPQGEPIKEPEFFSVIMKIWIGKKPAYEPLKDALLGKSKERPGNNANN
jgi:Chalcone isomerase-like